MGKTAQTQRTVSGKSKVGKIFISAVLGILALIGLIYFNRSYLVKTGVEIGVQKALGMKVSIDGLKLDLFPGKLEIKGLKVYNPPGFEGESLVKIPYINAEFDLLAFFAGKFHFRYLDVNINEINIVKNRHKELNLNRIQTIAKAGQGPAKPQANGKPASIGVKLLILTVNHIKLVDYSKPRASVQWIRLGIYREKFYNLRGIDDIVKVVAVKVVLKAGLYNLGLPFRNLAAGISDIGGQGVKAIGGAGRSINHGLKKLFGK